MGGSCLVRVDVELLSLAGGLCASPGNDDDVFVLVGVKCGSNQMDSTFTLVVGEVLRFTIRSLNKDTGYRSLAFGGDLLEPRMRVYK